MYSSELRLNDVGTAFRVTIRDKNQVVNLSQASTIIFKFRPPNAKTSIIRTGRKVTDGSDGKVEYISMTGDLNTPGIWRLQVVVTTPVGTWSSTIFTFRVSENI